MNFAFVFPGQGSQSVGMMAAYGESTVIRQAFAEEVAAKTEAIVTQAGLSGEAAAEIRREILVRVDFVIHRTDKPRLAHRLTLLV